ncbi:hypothetical protein CA983_14250 [Streptomyces swartbergensis]|uniref:Uncharacterized protein n=1 Tax=Streptomyces swartbergensis TaxID=487165 RepID=A0A243S5K2_9ACTN|nr:hypothetical protein CA983_14250 [Streptomyces swartbergensis]
MVAVLGTIGTVLGGWFVSRATSQAAAATARANEAAARAAAEPDATRAGLEVLQASLTQVAKENQETRAELVGLRALLRAYSWTVDRLITRMDRAGITPSPDDVHELVREHLGTGQ